MTTRNVRSCAYFECVISGREGQSSRSAMCSTVCIRFAQARTDRSYKCLSLSRGVPTLVQLRCRPKPRLRACNAQSGHVGDEDSAQDDPQSSRDMLERMMDATATTDTLNGKVRNTQFVRRWCGWKL